MPGCEFGIVKVCGTIIQSNRFTGQELSRTGHFFGSWPVSADTALDKTCTDEWAYYPRARMSSCNERRRTVGWKLYRLLGIEKGDKCLVTERAAVGSFTAFYTE